MMVPGSNILALALTVIGSTPVQYFQFLSDEPGPTGLSTATYAAPVTVLKGSVQPVDRARYTQYGLNYEKSYVAWFVPNVAASSITRNPDNDGDVIEANGRRYQLMSGTNWFSIDKWLSLLGVDIGPATGNVTNA
jgi:hypothetical protein